MRLLARSIHALSPVKRRLTSEPRAVVAAVACVVAALTIGANSAPQENAKPSTATSESDPERPRGVRVAATAKLVSGATVKFPRRGGAEHYRRTARNYVPPIGAAAFVPLYREAARQFGLNWRLIASIHAQETAFSTSPSTYRGLNPYGCCAGPMQFNVTNGPPSTWKTYRLAYREGRRPEHYPHRTRKHPSIYDDFDAIMAAGKLLSASGAGGGLDAAAWSAAYDYYGHDSFGITYASQILGRAVGWERDGFCPGCPLDEELVAQFEDAYGKAARLELGVSESDPTDPNSAGKRKADRAERRRRAARRKRAQREARERARRRNREAKRRAAAKAPAVRKVRPSPPRRTARRKPGPRRPPPQTPPTSTAPSTTPPPTPPPPVECPPIRKLLGCRP